jgi:hypothetical protein
MKPILTITPTLFAAAAVRGQNAAPKDLNAVDNTLTTPACSH